MSTKIERMNKIKSFLRIQSSSVTITEIHDALSRRMHLKISRKTIERDVVEMTESQIISVTIGVPSRYILNRPTEVEIILKIEEIKYILELIDKNSELGIKLLNLTRI